MAKSLVLNHNEISLNLDRIACHILEEHYNAESITVIGLHDRGSQIAEIIVERIAKFSNKKINLTQIELDKDNPFQNPITIKDTTLIKGISTILVDDVLNSGRTMAAAVKEVLNYFPKTLKVAVLANRDHHKFPIQADFVGISLATTLKEHISYEMIDGVMSVSLS